MSHHHAAQHPQNDSALGSDSLNRRGFLAQAAMVAVGALASACGNGQIGPDMLTAPNPAGTQITVSDFPALATVGELVKVDTYLAVKRTGNATFAAYSMICTHQGCLTSLQSNAFSCPCHGSQFDAAGQVTHGPANRPLPQYATSYNAATDTLTIG